MFTVYKDVHSLNERTDGLINEREEEGNCIYIYVYISEYREAVES